MLAIVVALELICFVVDSPWMLLCVNFYDKIWWQNVCYYIVWNTKYFL